MKRLLIILSAAFVLSLGINLLLSVRSVEAPLIQPIIRKGDSRQLVHTPDGHSFFGLASEKPLRIKDSIPFPKIVALTFDDGPNRKFTPQVLEILREHSVKATFFMVGDQVLNTPKIAADVAADGHQIGNHSFEHIAYETEDDVRHDQQVTSEVIRAATGVDPHVFRSPYGVISPAMLSGSMLPLILWSVDGRDWQARESTTVTEQVTKAIHPGAIILLHDTNQRTIDALPDIISELSDQGYSFVTVDELFGFSDPKVWRAGIGQYFSYATHRISP
ncbi:MAG: polysaccharide deacetylase family protein [Candidatus Peribacteraceae bacterium]